MQTLGAEELASRGQDLDNMPRTVTFYRFTLRYLEQHSHRLDAHVARSVAPANSFAQFQTLNCCDWTRLTSELRADRDEIRRPVTVLDRDQ
jgi:hypothetical protein